MIFARQQGDLQHSINKMALPVFVVDQEEDGEFRVIASNDAHTKVTGLDLQATIKKTPQMIFPNKADAEFLTSLYRTCVQQRKPVVYSSRLTYQDQIRDIRTILHPVSLDGKAPTRLVGQVAITATMPKDTAKDALSDHAVLAKADIQAIQVILDDSRRRQTICSKDLMLLSVLLKNRSLSLSEASRLSGNSDQSRRVRNLAKAEVGETLLADSPRAASG